MIYSDKVMDHFQNPRNVGTLPDADGVGQVGNPVCGDMMTFYVKVKDGRLTDVKFQTFGCGAAIAVSSMVSEMAIGKTVAEAMAITNEKVAEELGGLPKNKMHCSNLGADALHAALDNFKAKAAGAAAGPTVVPDHDHADEGDACGCPYCDGPVEGLPDICACKQCDIELVECGHCHKYTNKAETACTHCGAQLER
jgi:nitrogen fixation protein NifU and related proteins